MPSKVSARRQLKRERAALRKLRETGLYTGKLDLRKKPTRYQKTIIEKFADVVSGRAAVLKPANPESYAKLFTVKGPIVIVPKRKGETFKVDPKSGRIKGRRRTKGGTIKEEFIPVGAARTIKRSKEPAQYAIPFNRGDHIEWSRHPSFDALRSFMTEYARYKGWKKYAIGERDPLLKEDELDFEDDEDLTYILEEKLGSQYGASAGRFKTRNRKRGVGFHGEEGESYRLARKAARKSRPKKKGKRTGRGH